MNIPYDWLVMRSVHHYLVLKLIEHNNHKKFEDYEKEYVRVFYDNQRFSHDNVKDHYRRLFAYQRLDIEDYWQKALDYAGDVVRRLHEYMQMMVSCEGTPQYAHWRKKLTAVVDAIRHGEEVPEVEEFDFT